jgi:hypothetical protein
MGEQTMASGAIEVRDDGTLRLMPRRTQNPQGLADAVSRFAERLPSSDAAPHDRLSAASVWRGRRLGLSLEKMVETLERHSGQALPPKLREDLTRWSGQIDRLRLEVEGDRLILSSPNPLVITAVTSHRTLGPLVVEPLDPMRVELQAGGYPDLIATFDACDYPVLDRVPTDWVPPGTASDRERSRARSQLPSPWVQAPRATTGAFERRAATSFQCQAITTRGRQCKNRVHPPTRYCRVHADQDASPLMASGILSRLSWHAYLKALDEEQALSLEQIARSRVIMLMVTSLVTWLVFHLFSAGLRYGWGGSLPPWIVGGVAVVLSCGMLGRVVADMGVLSSLGYVGLLLGSIGFDCLHKEGLIVNLCYVVIPVLLPLWGLSQVGWSWAWVFACFPVSLMVGELLYTFLDAMST